MPTPRRSLALRIAAVLVVTAVCLGGVLWGLDLDVAREAAAGANPWMFVAMAALYLLADACKAVRFRLLLAHPVPLHRMLGIVLVGYLAINVIPLRLGEMVIPTLLKEREGVPLGSGLAGVFVARLMDVGALLVLLLGLTWVVELPPDALVIEGVDLVSTGQRVAGAVVLAGAVAGLVLLLAGQQAAALLRKLPAGPLVAGLVLKAREVIAGLVRQPLRAGGALLCTTVLWTSVVTGVGFALAAFPGVPANLATAWTTWTAIMSGMMVLPTPGFLGSFELFSSAALWVWGVPEALVRPVAVMLHMGQLGYTVASGVVSMLGLGLGLGALVKRAE